MDGYLRSTPACDPAAATRRSSRGRAASGFTLIELMMVIVIAGICLGIGVTGIAGAQNRIRLDRAASVLSDDIQSAFALVGRDRKPVRVVYDASKVRFLLTDRQGTNVFRVRSLGMDSEYKMTGSTIVVSDTAFEIYPPGLAEAALTITMKKNVGNKDSVTRIMTISRAGLVSVNNFK